MTDEANDENSDEGYLKLIEDFESRIKEDPNDVESRFILGSVHEEAEHLSLAEKLYREVIKINPDHPIAHFSLAKVLGKANRLGKALDSCKKAIEINSEEPEFYLLLAAIYDAQECLEEAAEACEKAVKLDTEDAEANFGLGSVYAKLGRMELAIEKYKDAIRLEPDYLEAHHNLALAYDAEQEGFSAIIHLRLARALMTNEIESAEAIKELDDYLDELYDEYAYEACDFEDKSEDETQDDKLPEN
jgi:tetratricopeptide (TPR) repeat protein